MALLEGIIELDLGTIVDLMEELVPHQHQVDQVDHFRTTKDQFNMIIGWLHVN
jgi:hypothetical protein